MYAHVLMARHFAPMYPLIHRPSMGYRSISPDLLLTIVLLGTAFADGKAGLRAASTLLKRIRNRIFEVRHRPQRVLTYQRVEEEPRATVSDLQTILLINQLSRSYCSQKLHDVAQVR